MEALEIHLSDLHLNGDHDEFEAKITSKTHNKKEEKFNKIIGNILYT